MRYSVPKLKGVDGAINANNSMARAFSNLGRQSQDYLNSEEKKRSNLANEAYKTDSLTEVKRHNSVIEGLQNDKFQYEKDSKKAEKKANAVTFRSIFPEKSSNIAMQYGDMPTKDNARSMREAFENINIKDFAENKKLDTSAKNWEKDFQHKVNQDIINNGLRRQELKIKKEKANKPNQIDMLISAITGTPLIGTNVLNGNITPTANESNATPVVNNIKAKEVKDIEETTDWGSVDVGASNKPQTSVDILTAKSNKQLTDDKGNVFEVNPITGRKTLLKKAKSKSVNMGDVDDLNKAIEVFNNLTYAKDNWKEDYTGFIDDFQNKITNELGVTGDDVEKYNKWAASLQSVANAARNKSFGAALSGFDIGEFSKEFPATDAGDGTIMPKLEARVNMLKHSLLNTYSAWVDNYGKEKADKYFSTLADKSIMGIDKKNKSQDGYSDKEIMDLIKGNK